MIASIFVIWIAIGVMWVKTHESGWAIMITNPKNTRRTWMAFPTIILCWILWPICNWVSRNMFLLSRL